MISYYPILSGYNKIFNKYFYTHPVHLWHRDGFDMKSLENIEKFYEKRYKQ